MQIFIPSSEWTQRGKNQGEKVILKNDQVKSAVTILENLGYFFIPSGHTDPAWVCHEQISILLKMIKI